MSYEKDQKRSVSARVLWGRIAILAGLLVLAFVLGRVTAPGADAAEDAEATRSDVVEAAAERADVTAEDTEVTAEDAGASERRTHEVAPDETLFSIAEDHYGDGGEWTRIAEANDLSRDDPTIPGRVLHIPSED